MLPLADLYPRDRLAVEVSLWSADLADLGAEVARLAPYADVFHIDASDTRFVPSPLFFPDLVAALRSHTQVPFHVHVMAEQALPLVEDFARAGADLLSVHAEADDVVAALQAVRARGGAAGLALRLDTPVDTVGAYLDDVDFVVLIGTPLGTKGTAMDPVAPNRVRQLRALAARTGRDQLPVIADGGIRENTVPDLADAGADAVVVGSLLLGSKDLAATTAWLHRRRGDAAVDGERVEVRT
ncbi:ribulose-phosphate 3-epimerase (plasmid) [Amycolatopsis sp. AA4]|uniref:ribulose-phosphate 3-epimerase n=1 Tax=Actinomycetes TaxID=1760 RepID=UPI0001B56173|nr:MULTISPECIES: ribulose-phosphate 3-epimerase [Actinomycetes]ATY16985.1 ribulose-phosphate 3-epimerase [Amycolatopsis sp. AA4]EFL12526.1 ribulose-phosphate 3-epimerase [Streptomyces sp. AA4]